MDVETFVRSYYDALRAGEALAPFFADADAAPDQTVVKFGVGERLVGPATVADGLREQTASTTDWAVESRDLTSTARDCHGWFADDVRMAWTDVETETRYDFETRWSGTLESRDESGRPSADGEWRFVGMHVSTAEER